MESKQGAKGAKSAGKRQSEDARFEEYTAELFCKEVSANTVSLHYTLKAPEKYGIEATDATFGQFEKRAGSSQGGGGKYASGSSWIQL